MIGSSVTRVRLAYCKPWHGDIELPEGWYAWFLRNDDIGQITYPRRANLYWRTRIVIVIRHLIAADDEAWRFVPRMDGWEMRRTLKEA